MAGYRFTGRADRPQYLGVGPPARFGPNYFCQEQTPLGRSVYFDDFGYLAASGWDTLDFPNLCVGDLRRIDGADLPQGQYRYHLAEFGRSGRRLGAGEEQQR